MMIIQTGTTVMAIPDSVKLSVKESLWGICDWIEKDDLINANSAVTTFYARMNTFIVNEQPIP